jgi:hypothetical protein
MHNKCQKCIKIRRFIVAFSCAVLIAIIGEQAGFSNQVTLWTSFAGAIAILVWFAK